MTQHLNQAEQLIVHNKHVFNVKKIGKFFRLGIKINTAEEREAYASPSVEQSDEPKGLSDSSQIAGMIMKNKFPIFPVHNIPAKYMIDRCWLY